MCLEISPLTQAFALIVAAVWLEIHYSLLIRFSSVKQQTLAETPLFSLARHLRGNATSKPLHTI